MCSVVVVKHFGDDIKVDTIVNHYTYFSEHQHILAAFFPPVGDFIIK